MIVSWLTSPPAVLRAHHAADALALEGPPAPGVAETVVPALGAFRGGLLFTPPNMRQDAIIAYFHGGGFVAGSPTSHRCVTSWLAALSGMPVLSAAYRLAPEHAFPAQAEDAVAAIAETARLRPTVFLAGDSAGASVVLWGWNALPAPLRQKVRGAALCYGAYGLIESDSITRLGTPQSGLDSPTLLAMYRRLGDFPSLLADPAFNALHPANLYDLPVYLLAAGQDPVLDDSTGLRDLLVRQGRAPVFVEVAGAEHGFLKRTGADPVATGQVAGIASWFGGLVD